MNYQKEEGWHHPQYYIMRHLLLNFLTKPDFIAYDWKARKGFLCGYAEIFSDVLSMRGQLKAKNS